MSRNRVAVSLLPAWHSVPGGTWTALRETVAAMERLDRPDTGPELVGVGARGVAVAPVDLSIPVVSLQWSARAAYLAWACGKGPSIGRAADADVVYLGAPAMPPDDGRPVVITLHDVFPLTHPEWFSRVGAVQMRRALAAARDRADAIIVSSEATRDDALAAGFAAERLTVVPLGVAAPEPTQALLAQRSATRERLGLPERYIAWIGTAEPRKGLNDLVAAWILAAPHLPDVELVLAGPDGWGEAVDLTSVPRARHIGRLCDVELDAFLASAGMFVFPSHAEGFGLPPLEAMARGVPALVRARTACAEFVADDDLIVESPNPGGWADRIVATWRETGFLPSKRASAQDRALRYSWDRTAEAAMMVIERLT